MGIVKGRFDGIVDVETFNKANRGKLIISIENGTAMYWGDTMPDCTV